VRCLNCVSRPLTSESVVQEGVSSAIAEGTMIAGERIRAKTAHWRTHVTTLFI
jgi:hypothetical protein